ncbi:methyltransferase protein [Xylographa parallela]|nr:methyltransferase protein [Xylographa parallela]
MDTSMQDDSWMPTFYVGQYETDRALPVTSTVLYQAHDCNYDMLTTPITTPFFRHRVQELVTQALQDNIDEDNQASIPTISPLSLPDTPLTPGDITSQLLAFVSPWIDICSPDPLISNISRQVLYLEIAYAAFCGIEYVFIPGPKLYHGDAVTHGTPQYARAVQEALSIGSHLSIHITFPMIADPIEEPRAEMGNLASQTRPEYIDEVDELRPQKPDMFGTWDAWNTIRTVSLSLPKELPPLSVQSRWYSEPIKLLAMTPDTFSYNKHNKPVLSDPLKSFITRLMRVKITPWILLCDVGPIPGLDDPEAKISVSDGFLSPDTVADAATSPTPAKAAGRFQGTSRHTDDLTPHLSYIRWLQRRQPPRTIVEKYGSGYQDYLQVPLQPLTDNLESMTYEVFEKDPVKYDLYELAVRQALRDWRDEGKPTSNPDGRVVVTIAGAGRGPLVTRALRASKAENVAIDLWAVEKNPNAYVLLQRHNKEDWDRTVTVVQSDMRSWKGPSHHDPSTFTLPNSTIHQPSDASSNPTHYPIDILISELLGSFADNELSPECLDGILHLLAPTCGISIPRAYTAFLTPIAAPKLHADLSSRNSWDPTASDTPAVVWLHAIDYLSLAAKPSDTSEDNSSNLKGKNKAPPADSTTPTPPIPSSPLILPTWSFHHGPQSSVPSSNTHNTRHARLSFRTRHRGVCHGLGGYFEAVLYPGIELSTNPETMERKSAGMISWFPIFFPLRTPLYLPDHSLLVVNIWRQTDGRKVWYEWMVEVFGYNLLLGGETRLVRLGGGEVGSSVKNGCMM